MNPRRWTILIVPHDSDSPRQYEVGERGLRLITGTTAAAVLLVLAALVTLFSGWATPGARLVARQNARLNAELARMESAVGQLGDSMEVLSDRESQFRRIAGMGSAPANETRAAAPMTSRPLSAERPRPFAQYFGNRADRTDPTTLLRRAGELSSAFATVSDSMAAKVERLRSIPNILPTNGWLTGAFSRARLHPILNQTRPHEGIDVSAPSGAPIVAPADGIVTKVTVENGYGNMLVIDHGNGIETLYAHCSRIVVRPGMHVDRGQIIAKVGNTGLAMGAHLHYEVIVNGKHVDPRKYVVPSAPPQDRAHE